MGKDDESNTTVTEVAPGGELTVPEMLRSMAQIIESDAASEYDEKDLDELLQAAGAFNQRFAEGRDWKRDAGLQRAIQFAMTGGVRSVVDLGAGGGQYVEWLREDYPEVLSVGVDGSEGCEAKTQGLVLQRDLTAPGVGVELSQHFDVGLDLVICIEVGEHIPMPLTDAFLQTIHDTGALRLLLSWAVPGQRGRNHVNCRSPEWVANTFGRAGWQLQWDATEQIRKIAGRGWNQKLLYMHR